MIDEHWDTQYLWISQKWNLHSRIFSKNQTWNKESLALWSKWSLLTKKNNNSSSSDVSTADPWFKPKWQKSHQIVFILETISMSLWSSGCHVAISAGWQSSYSLRCCCGKEWFCCHRNPWLLPIWGKPYTTNSQSCGHFPHNKLPITVKSNNLTTGWGYETCP